MPAKSRLKVPPAPAPEENLLREPARPLTYEERVEFRKALKSAAFQQALRNIRHLKPSAFTKDLNTALGSVVAANRLHQIQGWEMFETALGTQALDPAPKAPRAPEFYIDESQVGPTK